MTLTLESIKAAAMDAALPGEEYDHVYPDMVTGRTAHIDADFLAYMTSYERPDEDTDLEGIIYRTGVMIEDRRRQAGAEFAVLHMTPKGSDKGGRYSVAIQREYQGQRSSKDKPVHLEAVRSYMAALDTDTVKGIAWKVAEADDGMAEAAWKNHYAGTPDLCVIVTKDKDLRMCPGLHMDWDSGEVLYGTDDTFGYIDMLVSNSKSGAVKKKPWGYGTKFFWFQLLMGDTADNIRGCPKAPVDDKLRACGPVLAYALLRDAENDKDCLRICMEAYKANEYVHWKTGEPVSWQDVFWSEAQLLWMQRTPGDLNDVKNWVRRIVK